MTVIPERLVIDDEVYDLLEIGPNRRQWNVVMVASQVGDGTQPKPHFLEAHGGFGVSHRHTDSRGPVAPTHHDYAENVQTDLHGVIAPAPRITYIDCSALSTTGGSFRLGGYTTSRLGGATTGALGGGVEVYSPKYIMEFGDYLYVNAEHYTYVIDPINATLVETRNHGASAQARSSDVFDNALVVALGTNVDAEVATASYAPGIGSTWAAASGVQMAAVRVGGSGRLFAARNNLVYNVLPSQDPTLSANYLPTGGEVITDETDPVRALEEFARGLIAGTARTARTFDPEAGFISRAIAPRTRLSASEFDGKALLNTGEYLLYATGRVVWMFTLNGQRMRVGPELSDYNESPYIGGQPGIPDVGGDTVYWPYYFPDTGDSVIFTVTPRRESDPGIGPLKWTELVYLQDREVRCVRYWGGSSGTKPRLFFGAGTVGNPQQVGYIDLGAGGGPDLFNTDAQPALAGTLYYPHDDFGTPGTIKDVERLELPLVEHADADNYWTISVSDDDGATWIDLVKAQSGSNQERVNTEGFVVLYPPVADVPSGRELVVKASYVQASGATEFLRIHGEPVLYLSERPSMVRQVSTLIRASGSLEQEGHRAVLERLEALVSAGKVKFRHDPDDRTFYGKVYMAKEVETEIDSPTGQRQRVVAIELTWREVATE